MHSLYAAAAFLPSLFPKVVAGSGMFPPHDFPANTTAIARDKASVWVAEYK